MPKKTEDCRSDVRINSLMVNSFLTNIMKLENGGAKLGINYPWGSSVSLVAQKL
mgnify:FL=1